ncbi:MAG TPA: hypothetical protein VD908_08520 [Cytophagales bacterium]|nr:hypothetical protein [Cytophagales bacterium]
MKRIFQFLIKNIHFLFWLSIVLFFLAALSLNKSTKALNTEFTPKSILDLQLAWSDSSAYAIKNLWFGKQIKSENKDSTYREYSDSLVCKSEKDALIKSYVYDPTQVEYATALSEGLRNVVLDSWFFIPAYLLFLFVTSFVVSRSAFRPRFFYIIIIWLSLFVILYSLMDLDYLPVKLIFFTSFFISFAFLFKKPSFKLIGITILGVGILDWVENYFLYQFLAGSSVRFGAISFALPASLKMGLLLLPLGFIIIYGWSYVFNTLRRISLFLKNFLYILWINRVITVVLLVVFFLLWKSDQGQDVLVNLNSKFQKEPNDIPLLRNTGPFLLYIILTVIAFINWFLPKYFFIKDSKKITWKSIWKEDWNYSKDEVIKKEKVGYQIFTARLFGVLTFIIPACGILKALDTFELSYSLSVMGAEAVFLLTVIFYILALYPFFDSEKAGTFHKSPVRGEGNNLFEECFEWLIKNREDRIIGLVLGFFMLCIILFGFNNTGHPTYLGNLSVGLYMVSFMFAFFVSVRRRLGCYDQSRFRKFWIWMKKKNINAWILSAGIVVSLIFLVFNIFPFLLTGYSISRSTTLIVVLTGVVFYVFLFSLLILMGHKYRINFAGILILLMLFSAFSFDNNFHDVELIDNTTDQKITLDQYIEQWLSYKKEEIARYKKEGKLYPVIIVNAYGGGIRAAAWTSMVVNYLDCLIDNNPDGIINENFQDYVLAYSGASGGTIGASVSIAMRRDNFNKMLSLDSLVSFYQRDFLTPVIIGFLGRDVFFSTFNIKSMDDRGKLQTQLWERHLDNYSVDFYQKEYAAIWESDKGMRLDIPLLFANTYHLESGRKGIIAPVSLRAEDFPTVVFINDSLLKEQKTVRFSTGAFLSARFPFISPAGKIMNGYHFLDGGLKDNSGAQTALEIKNVFDRVLGRLILKDSIFENIEILNVSLNNMAPHEPELPDKNLFELTAPAQGLMNGWIGNTFRADSINKIVFKDRYFAFKPLDNLIKLEDKKPFKPVLPLGWQISYPALVRLKTSLNYRPVETNNYFRLLQKFSKKTNSEDVLANNPEN